MSTETIDWREAREALDCAVRLKGFLQKHGYTIEVLDTIIEKLTSVKDPPKVVVDFGS